jgi:hypothetical protein
MNLISYGSILAFVAGGGKGFAAFWLEGLKGALHLASLIWQRIV